MAHPGRRKSDHSPPAEPLDDKGPEYGQAGNDAWVRRCSVRILALDPTLSADEAIEIAGSMRAFERTGAMEPEAAVDFVVSQMRKDAPIRFERRGAA